jgi:aryl-phospho-beta-D-glucosidase BglC (GH1 family)
MTGLLRVQGATIVDGSGEPVRLKGTNIGGWLNMENFITGYSGNESMMRAAVRKVLGGDAYELFFDRLLTAFYGDADAAFLAQLGLNCVRIPVNYRHLESDLRPLEIIEDGFRHLDRAVEAGAANGVYSIIDLHALPGSQNQHWHSDNPTHRALFWEHRHFQDRVVNLWEAIADRYKGNAWVAGYNLMNEPADESRAVVGPFYERLAAAIRAVDPDHILLFDGNTYSTEFGFFGDPLENAVYTLHDYVPAGLGRADHYDPEAAEQKFLERSAYARETGTPIYVGEFAPIYTGDAETDAVRVQILEDQLERYRRYDAGFATWMYKDLGRQGLTFAKPDSAYGAFVADFVAKKIRLGVDQWGSSGRENPEVTQPIQDLVAREAPDFDPYPWGRFDFVRTLVLNIALAQPLVHEYAELFRGLGEDELLALADSFAFERCGVRETLRDQLERS